MVSTLSYAEKKIRNDNVGSEFAVNGHLIVLYDAMMVYLHACDHGKSVAHFRAFEE